MAYECPLTCPLLLAIQTHLAILPCAFYYYYYYALLPLLLYIIIIILMFYSGQVEMRPFTQFIFWRAFVSRTKQCVFGY